MCMTYRVFTFLQIFVMAPNKITEKVTYTIEGGLEKISAHKLIN